MNPLLTSNMRVVVYGGKGALGSTLVNHFKTKSWWVCSIDLSENPEADVNVVVKGANLQEQAANVSQLVNFIYLVTFNILHLLLWCSFNRLNGCNF